MNENITIGLEELKNGIWPRSVPLWMSAFYVALFIIRPWEALFPELAEFRFERIYAIIMILTVLLTSKKQLRFTIQSFSIVLFWAAIGISALVAWDSALSKEPFYEYRNLVIFYFILLFVIRSYYELVFLVISYIFTMFIYLAKAQWEFFIHGQHRYDMGVIRMVGIENSFGGPNNLAMSIVVSLPFLLFLWTIRKEISQTWPLFWQKWFKRFLIIYAYFAVSSIILTNSRSGMLGFVLFILLVTFRGKGLLRKFSFVIGGILIVMTIWQFVPEENKNRVRTIWDKEAGPKSATHSADGRIEGFNAGIEMFSRFPITGVGIGNFIEYRVIYIDGVGLQAHNLIGQLLGETGLIGCSVFIFMVLIILINLSVVNKTIKNYGDTELIIFKNFSLAIRNSLLLLFFLGMFGHNLFRFNWLWLAVFADQLRIILTEKYFNND